MKTFMAVGKHIIDFMNCAHFAISSLLRLKENKPRLTKTHSMSLICFNKFTDLYV